MKAHWRTLAGLLPLAIEKKIYQQYFQHAHKKLEKRSENFPPSHLSKQQLLKRIAKDNDLNVLVETGTYLGDMIFAMQDEFDKIYSIELSSHFFQKAKHRFKKYSHITLIHGDSGKVLSQLLPKIDRASIFWLDGHYSGGLTAKGEKECPIYEELKHILKSSFDHTIIVDDARLFVGQHDYPTIDELKNFVLALRPQAKFSFENDAIIIKSK